MNDRARVPFAIVGVLLLVSSATLTATVRVGDSAGQPAVDHAMESATAEAMTALRAAGDDAATETAAAPVIRPANTTAGRALNGNRPFRDALRLRLYLTAREHLEAVGVRRNGVVATASLPRVEPTEAGYRAAIERVTVERTGEGGAAIRFEIEGVGLRATRNGRKVATAERSPSFVVANPALLLHDRTERFEERASAPVTRPGVGRRLTARLYPIAWTRGYAQYGGAPIANVLANRHVELATNDALLAEQQAAFGTVDPAGDRGVAVAGRRVAATDLLVGAGGEEEWVDAVLSGADEIGPAPPADRPIGARRDPPESPEVTVGVNASADRAFASFVGLQGSDDLSRIVDRAHTVEARLAAEVDERGVERSAQPRPVGDWQLVDSTTSRSREIEEAGGISLRSPGWQRRDEGFFFVRRTETTTHVWQRDNETRTRTERVERTYHVRLALQARTAPIPGVPAGDLDGALSNATERATGTVLDDAGGFAPAALDAVDGDRLPNATATAEPIVDRERLETELEPLREQVRTVAVSVPAPAVGAGRANPPAMLQDAVTERRDGFRSPYAADAGTRTRYAAETAYLDEVDDELSSRASRHEETNAGIGEAVSNHLDPDRLDGAIAAHRNASRPEPERYADPAGDVSIAVDASPSYLTVGEVPHDRIDTRGRGGVRSLAARNVNVFTSPHEQVADGIVDHVPLLGRKRVPLRTAARTLEAMEPMGPSDERDALETDVESAAEHVRDELLDEMTAAGVPEEAASEALESEADTATRALELANGTAVDRSLAELEGELENPDRLRFRLETTLEGALRDPAARPSQPIANEATDAAREAYREELADLLADGIETENEHRRKQHLGERMGSIPAGLPIAPVPGYWYATANVWYVQVAGRYERFVVRANRGGPIEQTTYVRDNRTAQLRHDGARLVLGSADRVSFRTETAVVVVVPPGGSGVGDTDGVVDERSPGLER